MVTIKLYCSICGRNDYYLERIETIAKRLDLDYSLEKVTDEAVWKALGLEEACLFAYCPGCKTMHADIQGPVLPALEVNGVLRFWSVPATDEELAVCFSEFC